MPLQVNEKTAESILDLLNKRAEAKADIAKLAWAENKDLDFSRRPSLEFGDVEITSSDAFEERQMLGAARCILVARVEHLEKVLEKDYNFFIVNRLENEFDNI